MAMANQQSIHIGFIGAGGIARQRHLPNLRPFEGVEVVAVCNRSEESSRAVADEFGIPEIETDWRKLVQRDDLDAIFIGTWPYRHKEMSVAALEAGKHVFCQARMAMNLAEARAMLAAAEAHPELVNMICPPPHRMPAEPYIQQVIDSGELGELREVHLVSVNDADLGPLNWRERVEFSGLQALQVGIWAETLHAWVGEYETLSATTGYPIRHKRDEDGSDYAIRIPQVVLVHGRLQNGAVISEHHSGVSQHETANHVTITGSKGTLHVEAMGPVRMGRIGGPLEVVDVPETLQKPWQVEQDFIAAVRAAKQGESWQVSPDFAEGIKYMRKVEAIHHSAANRQAVRPGEL